MVSSIQRSLTLFMIAVLLLHPCYASSDGAGFSWRFENRGSEDSTLTECETLNISILPTGGDSSNIGRGPYYLQEFEPNGASTTTLLGHTPSSLHWQVRRRAGSQLLLSLMDSQGTSGGVHPILFTVETNATGRGCLRVGPLSSPLSPLQPEIVSSVIGQIPPCGAWDLSVSGGRAPYTISVISLGSPTVYNFSLPRGQKSFTYHNRGGISGRMVAAVSDSRGLLGMTTSIVDISGFSSHGIPCLPASQNTLSIRRFKRHAVSLIVDWSRKDMIVFAVCISFGGTALLAGVAFAAVSYRRRKRGLIAGQDTLPRPFEITVPAPTSTSTTTLARPNADSSLPVLDISPRNNNTRTPETQGRNAPRLPTMPSPSSQVTEVATAARGPRTPHQRPSDSSLRSSHEHHATHSHDYPRSRTTSRTATQGPGHPRTRSSPSPAEPTQKAFRTRTTKGGLYTSRSASDMYRAASSVPRYRMYDHENVHGGPSTPGNAHLPHHAHTYPLHAPTRPSAQQADVGLRATNQLRHYHSASPIVRPERNADGNIILQHRDAGVVHEPPPPYH